MKDFELNLEYFNKDKRLIITPRRSNWGSMYEVFDKDTFLSAMEQFYDYHIQKHNIDKDEVIDTLEKLVGRRFETQTELEDYLSSKFDTKIKLERYSGDFDLPDYDFIGNIDAQDIFCDFDIYYLKDKHGHYVITEVGYEFE